MPTSASETLMIRSAARLKLSRRSAKPLKFDPGVGIVTTSWEFF